MLQTHTCKFKFYMLHWVPTCTRLHVRYTSEKFLHLYVWRQSLAPISRINFTNSTYQVWVQRALYVLHEDVPPELQEALLWRVDAARRADVTSRRVVGEVPRLAGANEVHHFDIIAESVRTQRSNTWRMYTHSSRKTCPSCTHMLQWPCTPMLLVIVNLHV